MSRRFYFQSDPAQPVQTGDAVLLDSGESHHLIHVIRAKPGDRIYLFNGSGFEFESEIVEVQRRQVKVRLISSNRVDRELDRPLVIAIPFPKSDRQKFLVEKLTEIGTTAVQFIFTANSGEQGNLKTVEKLRRLVIEASKQCGRNQLMKLHDPIKLSDLVLPKEQSESDLYDRFFAHPGVESNLPAPLENVQSNCKGQMIVIGPEGGLDDDEIVMLRKNGWKPLNLGKSILRMETAALVAATLLSRS